MPEAQELRDLHGGEDTVLDQCCFGLDFVKPTQLLSNVRTMKKLGRRCCHGPKAHPVMEGKADGKFVTSAQSAYPPELCRALAGAFVASFREFSEEKRHQAVEEIIAEDICTWRPEKCPAVGATWDDIPRWRELYRLRWKEKEHNNIGELRMTVQILRHLSRSRKYWDRRHLVISDSLVAIGVIAKGRSSSPPLLRLARAAAAVQMVLGVRPYMRWVESERNWADGPSRGHPVGVAPKEPEVRRGSRSGDARPGG